MSNFQTPWDFHEKEIINNFEIRYDNCREIGQGSPIIGDLYINNIRISTLSFSGPYLFQNDYLYVPVYLYDKEAGWCFKLAIINILKRNVEVFGEPKNLIHLDKIEGGGISYFTSWDQTKQSYYENVIR